MRSKGQGAAMLDKMRQAGKPITPQMEKMAAWMDKMEAQAAGGMADGGEPPLLKPGPVCDGGTV
jgi:hypothetical protein